MKEVKLSLKDYNKMGRMGAQADVFGTFKKILEGTEEVGYSFQMRDEDVDMSVVMVFSPENPSMQCGVFTSDSDQALYQSVWYFDASKDGDGQALKMTKPVTTSLDQEEELQPGEAVSSMMALSAPAMAFFINTLEPHSPLEDGLSITIDLTNSKFIKTENGVPVTQPDTEGRILH